SVTRGGRAPGRWGDRPATRAIDGLAVVLDPPAYAAQSLDKFRLNFSRGHGADVEQEVGAVSSGARQILDQLRGALEVLVVFVIAPRIADGVAGFERQLADLRSSIELRRLLTGQVLFEHLKIL